MYLNPDREGFISNLSGFCGFFVNLWFSHYIKDDRKQLCNMETKDGKLVPEVNLTKPFFSSSI